MKKIILVFICLTFLVVTTYGAENPNGNYREIILDEAVVGNHVDLPSDSMIVLKLPANPSTGYQWEVINYSQVKSFVKEVKGSKSGPRHPEYLPPEVPLPGAPQTQILRFVGEKGGMADVTLAYRRPWEGGHERLLNFTVSSKGKFTGNFIPPRIPKARASLPPEAYKVKALPSHFDWREQGGVTPVKNQGSCGSCWAYGSAAAFEAKILIKDGVTRDLAEQYLVSCNDDGFSCAGGWWAHDYHWFKCIASESGAGARYEADFPYQASDVPCNPPHTPNEQLEGWAYTDDVPDSAWPTIEHAPTVAQIKEKIYNYGPVGTDVCSTTWGSYTGGVFTSDCSPGTHIVLITGWDDSEGCFYIKNSWGTGWGENGYMRLAYNTCLVGYYSTYLLYEKNNPRILYRSTIFHEDKDNDGSINNSLELRIEDSTSATQFAVTGGYMTEGTHFSVSNLPANLNLSIQGVSATEAVAYLTGNANAHLDVDDVANLTVTFHNAAFTGGDASAVENATFSELQINFFDPYQLIYFDPADVTINPSNVWQFYWLEGSNSSYSFGLWWYDSANEPDPDNNQCLKLETYTKPALSHGTAIPPDLVALNYGDVIGPNSNYWAAGGSYGGQHTLTGPAYSDWKGQTRYVGFSFSYNGYPVYGWMRIQISPNGTEGTILDYAWQQDPNKTIRAGYTDSPPAAPEAAFTADNTTVTVGSAVQFTDQSANNPTSWQWTFTGGTPSSSTSQNPSITYNTIGTYDVSLTATNTNGSDTETKTAYITVTETGPVTYCGSQGNDYSYEWIAGVSVGDLNNSSGAAGYSDFTSQTANLGTGTTVNVTLTPGFSGSAYTEHWRIWIDYNADGDFEDSGEEVFGNSGNSAVTGSFTVPSISDITTRMRVSMLYNSAPPYCGNFDSGEVEDYTVTITDGGGGDPPVAEFSAGNTTILEGQSVNFTDLSTNTPTSWSWSFAGGAPSTSTSQNPTVTYSTAGTYQVSLTATNAYGSDTETKTAYITVNTASLPPVADFNADNTTIIEDGSVNFTDTSTNTPTSWSWTFEGGTPASSTQQNPAVTYSTAGTYQVSLTATNAYGSDTETKVDYITVNESSPQAYCSADFGNPAGQYITNVSVSTIDNDSTYVTGGYQNFTSQSTTLEKTNDYPITVTPHSSWGTSECGIWVDWNQDGDFSDSGETVLTYSGEGPWNATITPPAGAALGTTRMRIVAACYETLSPCITGGYHGEAEDYSIIVAPDSPGYCTASHLYDYGYITNVTVGSIDNDSTWGSNGYADFTSQSTTMQINTGYSINVTCYQQHWPLNSMGIWVDWNQDGDFGDAGETIYTTIAAGPYSTTITPPAGAATGTTRMRVRMLYDKTAIPCGADTYFGDVEDYTINVTN